MKRRSALFVSLGLVASVLTTGSSSQAAPVLARQPLCVAVPGGVSGDVAVVNITNTNASGSGYGALRSSDARSVPSRAAADQFSSVNFAPGSPNPNLAFVTIGSDGRFCYDSDGGSSNVILDLAATIPAGNIDNREPDRLVDTRTPTPTSTPTSVIGQGVSLVPSETEVGRYRTIVTGGFCLVRRLSSPLDRSEDRIEQLAWPEGEQAIIDIASSDVAFRNDSDCGQWLPIGGTPSALRPSNPFPFGDLLVGIDVQPGTYRTTVPVGGFCLVQRLSGFGGSRTEVIDQQAFSEGESGFIEIEATDVGFHNDSDCGTWSRV